MGNQETQRSIHYEAWSSFMLGLIPVLFLVLLSRRRRTGSPSLPLAGRHDEWFSWTRANLREYWPGAKTITEGYIKFGTQGQTFLVPDISFRDHVIIPYKHLKWLITLPPSIVSSQEALRERQALKYVLPHYSMSDLAILKQAIRRGFTQNLNKIQEDMYDEVQQTVDSILGVDGTWTPVKLSSLLEVTLRKVTSRMFMGPILSHNEQFDACLTRFCRAFGISSFVVGQLVPCPFRQIMAWLIGPIAKYHHGRVKAHLSSLFDERCKIAMEKGLHTGEDAEKDKDMISIAVDAYLAQRGRQGSDTDLESVKSIFVTMTMAGILSMAGPLTNTFLDLLSSEPELRYYDILRKEAETAFAPLDWASNPELPKLAYADSAIRESMRLNPPGTRLLSRLVTAKEGVILPDGSHVSNGSTISVAANIQRDEMFYKDGNQYNALRFANPDASDKQTACLLTVTSDIFVAFGHGSHTCTGRFYAAHLMKLIVAYITMNYDAKPLKQRPSNILIADLNFPKQTTMVWFKRRSVRDREEKSNVTDGTANIPV